jgi:DNA-binding NarL/FixJ family response regulator
VETFAPSHRANCELVRRGVRMTSFFDNSGGSSAVTVELTPRQHLIAAQLSAGCTDDEIAELLTISVRTVRYEVSRLLEVLEVRTRFAAGVRYARRRTPTN